MNKIKTIVFLVPEFPRDTFETNITPSVQIYFRALMEKFPETKLTVISLDYPFYSGNYFWYGNWIFLLGGKYYKGVFRFIKMMKVFYTFFKVNYHYSILGIHSFGVKECGKIGEFLSKFFKLPYLTTITRGDLMFADIMTKTYPELKTFLTAPSEKAQELFAKFSQQEINAVVESGIENDLKFNSNVKRSIDIVCFDEMNQLEEVEEILQILAQVKKVYKNVRCIIVSSGVFKNQIELERKNRNLSLEIKLIGKQQRSLVHEILNRSKILLHMSGFEIKGLIYLEALRFGCEIVCRKTMELPESKKFHFCSDANQMSAEIISILNKHNDFKPEIHRTINETVEKFINVYEKAGMILLKSQKV